MTPERQPNDFELLVSRLNEVLGPYKGIDSDDIDPKELEQLMIDYVSNDAHWQKYFFPSEHQAYTRNLVDRGNGKCNLVSFLECCAVDSMAALHRGTHLQIESPLDRTC